MSLQPVAQIESSTYFFNARELARLAIYRAAVVARFYTDQCDPTRTRSSFDNVRVFDVTRGEQHAA